jgi:hypothetical protein
MTRLAVQGHPASKSLSEWERGPPCCSRLCQGAPAWTAPDTDAALRPSAEPPRPRLPPPSCVHFRPSARAMRQTAAPGLPSPMTQRCDMPQTQSIKHVIHLTTANKEGLRVFSANPQAANKSGHGLSGGCVKVHPSIVSSNEQKCKNRWQAHVCRSGTNRCLLIPQSSAGLDDPGHLNPPPLLGCHVNVPLLLRCHKRHSVRLWIRGIHTSMQFNQLLASPEHPSAPGHTGPRHTGSKRRNSSTK